MRLLIEGYTQVSNGIEDWMHVLSEAKVKDPPHAMHYDLLLMQLQLLLETVQPIRENIAALEDAFKELGLTPRNDPSELDKIWGDDPDDLPAGQ